MASIKVLSKEISELIAAGEVIERPASVIKELVENSVDSGASHITVEIKNGGITYMRVADDGCGMSFEDVPTAFLRHATSKIAEKSDLDNIITLGFRGEALSSVSAVSKVEVMTKQHGETYGTIYSIEGSGEKSHERSGCPDGTTIIIRDLFYNTPARLKFLKKDVSEANAVSSIMHKIALSHPDVSFKLIRDNRVEFNSAGDGDLFSAIYSVYGKDFARDLLKIDYEYKNIHVIGYTVKPLYSRANRTFQNFFVNGRYIRSKLCSSALENAYENMIMTGKFPACVIMINMPPSVMDVNIHPSKAEIRFTDEKSVSDAVYFAVKSAFIDGGLLYDFEFKQKSGAENTVSENISNNTEAAGNISKNTAADINVKEDVSFNQESIFTLPENIAEKEKIFENNDTETETDKITETAENTAELRSVPEPEYVPEITENFRYINPDSFETPVNKSLPEISEKKKPDIRIIGEAFGLYILAEVENKMIIIDKHAAHERIIFERLKSRNCKQYSQILMTGIKLLLVSDEIDVMEDNAELLAGLGFQFDFSERPYITVKAVPTFIMDTDIENIISEVVENLKMHKQNPQSCLLDDMLHNMACKAAIKANDKNTPEEMKALAEQIFADENIRHCPHGRPVMFTMTKSSIDHQFKRT